MARIRHIEVRNFRCVQEFTWLPSPGVNCLIGPGDSGKSSILDAIDFCLGAKRSIQFTDADFYCLDVEAPISITITIGELDDALKNMDVYGQFLRGFTSGSGEIEDEPSAGAETVLTLNLMVGSDLDPVWTLISERAAAQGLSRYLTWGDRVRLSPTRIGALADHHLAWRRGSVLNKLSDERADASAALARAAREARSAFGDLADEQLGETLKIVSETAKELGIPAGENLKAMLEAHSVSFGGGTISLHGENGVPLRALGIGSTRLLIAGLQRKAAAEATVIMIDELEHGLEPHRIIRLLGSIGAKEKTPPLQAFVTTHSPVALRELSGSQLVVIRKRDGSHQADVVGTEEEVQSTIRLFPDAFLAPAVLVAEGASEVGLLRGLDQFRVAQGALSITACGVALVDAGGCDKIYKRAVAFNALGYRAAVLRDDDAQPDAGIENEFVASGGTLFKWRPGRALEDELFASLSDDAVAKLVDYAVALHGEELIDAHIQSASGGLLGLDDCRADFTTGTRDDLAKASRTKKAGWFKSVSWMEEVAREIVGPDLETCDWDFRQAVDDVFGWMCDAG